MDCPAKELHFSHALFLDRRVARMPKTTPALCKMEKRRIVDATTPKRRHAEWKTLGRKLHIQLHQIFFAEWGKRHHGTYLQGKAVQKQYNIDKMFHVSYIYLNIRIHIYNIKIKHMKSYEHESETI